MVRGAALLLAAAAATWDIDRMPDAQTGGDHMRSNVAVPQIDLKVSRYYRRRVQRSSSEILDFRMESTPRGHLDSQLGSEETRRMRELAVSDGQN